MLIFFSALETSATAEHVVAESGGEDSEDEWNYVKVDKKESEEQNDNSETNTPKVTPSDNIDHKLDQVVEENDHQHHQDITLELVSNVTSLINETSDELQHILAVGESHALLQGIAESQEACADVSFSIKFICFRCYI